MWFSTQSFFYFAVLELYLWTSGKFSSPWKTSTTTQRCTFLKNMRIRLPAMVRRYSSSLSNPLSRRRPNKLSISDTIDSTWCNNKWRMKAFSPLPPLYIYINGFTRHIILKITPSTQRIILPRINTFKIVPVPTITSTIYFFLLKINLYINFKLLVTILLYNSLNWCYNKGCLTRNIPKQWPCTLKSYWMF